MLAQQAAAMDVDIPEPTHQAAHPTAVGMEWDSGEAAVSQAATRRRLSPPEALSPLGAAGAPAADMEVDAQPERQPAAAAAGSCGTLELEGVPCTLIEDSMQWLETHTGCERHMDRVAVLTDVHAAQPTLLQDAASGDSCAQRMLHTRLAAAVRSRFGAAAAPENAYYTEAARDADGQLRVPPGFEDHHLARRVRTTPAAQTQPVSSSGARAPPQTPAHAVAAVARAMRGLGGGDAVPRYPARERRAPGRSYESSRAEGRGQRPSQP
jgi:hypothetical protein